MSPVSVGERQGYPPPPHGRKHGRINTQAPFTIPSPIVLRSRAMSSPATDHRHAPGKVGQPSPPHAAQTTRAGRLIAVGGGKGGIGKSLLSTSLGIELAQQGQRVALVDLDLGGANLHTCLGMAPPERSLSDFVYRRAETLGELLVPTGVEGLSLISGSQDALAVANPLHQQKLRLMRAVQGLDVDVAILDLGAGSHYNVLDFFLLADQGIVTLVPDPTSVENAYRFIKAAFFRRLRALEAYYGFGSLLEDLFRSSNPQSPAEFLEKILASHEPEVAERLVEQVRAFRPALVVNSVREASDLALGEGICTAWRRFFGIELDYLGYVRHDDEAWRAARLRRPLLLEREGQPIAQDIAEIASKLLAGEGREAP